MFEWRCQLDVTKIWGRKMLWTLPQWHPFDYITLTSFLLLQLSCWFKSGLIINMVPSWPEGSIPCKLLRSIFRRSIRCFMYSTAPASTSRTLNYFSSSGLGFFIVSRSHLAVDFRKIPGTFEFDLLVNVPLVAVVGTFSPSLNSSLAASFWCYSYRLCSSFTYRLEVCRFCCIKCSCRCFVGVGWIIVAVLLMFCLFIVVVTLMTLVSFGVSASPIQIFSVHLAPHQVSTAISVICKI